MADCMVMVHDELVAMGIIDQSVAPMFIPEAVAAYVQRSAVVPQGWRMRKDQDDVIVVQHDKIGGYVSSHNSDNIASTILYHLADDLLKSAAQANHHHNHQGASMDTNEFDMDKINALPVFDVADHLDSDSMIVAYLTEFIGEENTVLLRAAIENVARALAQRTAE